MRYYARNYQFSDAVVMISSRCQVAWGPCIHTGLTYHVINSFSLIIHLGKCPLLFTVIRYMEPGRMDIELRIVRLFDFHLAYNKDFRWHLTSITELYLLYCSSNHQLEVMMIITICKVPPASLQIVNNWRCDVTEMPDTFLVIPTHKFEFSTLNIW